MTSRQSQGIRRIPAALWPRTGEPLRNQLRIDRNESCNRGYFPYDQRNAETVVAPDEQRLNLLEVGELLHQLLHAVAAEQYGQLGVFAIAFTHQYRALAILRVAHAIVSLQI